MKNETVYCPYCGPWNGHQNGVEMIPDDNSEYDCITNNYYLADEYWYGCPVCHRTSPHCATRKEARAAALRRFTPPQKPLELDELRPGDVVWMEEREKGVYYCIRLDYWSRSTLRDLRHRTIPIEKFRLDGSILYSVDQYGKKWRCWRERPTYDECTTADWEV